MRRLFIIRKDLHLSSGKLAAMVGHCCEAYWTNFLKDGPIYDQEYEHLPTEIDGDKNYWMRYRNPGVYNAAKAAHEKGLKTFTYPAEFPVHRYGMTRVIDKDIWDEYVNGIFTKTICEAKNLNQLLKVKGLIEDFNEIHGKENSLFLSESRDFGWINDKCLTELNPENDDGTTTVGIWFRPLPDDIAHFFSKKYKLYCDRESISHETNFEHYKTLSEAEKAYSTKFELIYNLHEGVSAGRFVRWLYEIASGRTQSLEGCDESEHGT